MWSNAASPRSANFNLSRNQVPPGFDSEHYLKMSRSSSRGSSDSDSRDPNLQQRGSAISERNAAKDIGGGCTKLASGLYRCNICSYEAMYASAVKIHLRSHSGEKPFQCQYCNYKSTTSGNLKTHLRKHTGETPFVCNVCNFKAKHKITLKSHMANVHQITIDRYSSYAIQSPVISAQHPANFGRTSGDGGDNSQMFGDQPSEQDLRMAFDGGALLRHQQMQKEQQQQKQRGNVHHSMQQDSDQQSQMRFNSATFSDSDQSEQIEKTLEAFGTIVSGVSGSSPATSSDNFASHSVSISPYPPTTDNTQPPAQ